MQVNPDTLGQHFGRAALRDDMGFGYGGDMASRHDIAYTLWEKRYIFRKEMLPTFLNEDFGKKVCIEPHLSLCPGLTSFCCEL